jgi:ATP phosphoribosyltransferase
MTETVKEIRLALPSKGPLAEPALALFAAAGLAVYHPNPRQYEATIPNLPRLTVLFQRPGDIVVSVREGSVDFGITGGDMVAEKQEPDGRVLMIHPALGFGQCTLNVIVPEAGECPGAGEARDGTTGLLPRSAPRGTTVPQRWEDIEAMADLSTVQTRLDRPLRVATKFPRQAKTFFDRHGLVAVEFISAEGTLEIAPVIGYADLITDLVSTGVTLRDNRLKRLTDGQILASQACLIANRARLQSEAALGMIRTLLEFIVAHLRARENVSIFANMRGVSAAEIAARMFTQSVIGGLQGPTLSPVITRQGDKWFAANLIVRKDQLSQAISELRQVGGSGVVVTPVTYIFEEEPIEYRNMLNQLKEEPQ